MNLSNKHEKYFRGLVCNNERANFCVITCVFDKKTAAVPSRGPLAAPATHSQITQHQSLDLRPACVLLIEALCRGSFDDCGEQKYVLLIGLEMYNSLPSHYSAFLWGIMI